MKRSILVPLFALLLAGFVLRGPVAAQDATPISVGIDQCTLTPPSREHLSLLAATPIAAEAPAVDASPVAEGTPGVALPAGQPVDDATRAAVEQSMIVNLACINSGSTLLALAAFSDVALAEIAAGAGEITQEEYDAIATPVAIPDDQRNVILEFQDMVMLEDGRIAAMILGDNLANDNPPSVSLFYLSERDGHWYIDDTITSVD